jgi:choline dehydrogenase-like flavoprotein
VLEAGIADHRWDPIITMPAALGFPVGNRRYDWCYATEPEPHMQNRRMRQPRGKILGGSSSINGMMYHRGHPADFDQWAAETGEPGWDYAHVLPYFQRHEHVLTADPEAFRGHAGPQILEPAEARGPLFDAFFAAPARPATGSPPASTTTVQEGVAPAERMIHNGRRLSASRAYLAPIRARANLGGALRGPGRPGDHGGHPRGRRLLPPGLRREERVFAGEVVLCGGAMGTPHVLQLSGIGPAGRAGAGRGAGGPRTSPPSGRTWRTTSRCTCSTGARSRSRCWRCARSTAGPDSRRNGCSPAPVPGASNHQEATSFYRSDETQDRTRHHDVRSPRWRCAARKAPRSTGTATSCTSA